MPEAILSKLPEVVAELRAARESWRRAHVRNAEYGNLGFPSREAIGLLVDQLSAALFPIRLGPADLTLDSEDGFVAQSLESALPLLAAQLERELTYDRTIHGTHLDIVAETRRIALGLAQRLPAIRRLLDTDIEAAYLGDPAARSLDEVLLCYPCVIAIVHHRIAHELIGWAHRWSPGSWLRSPIRAPASIFTLAPASARAFSWIMAPAW